MQTLLSAWLSTCALAADLEGTPTYGLFPGTAGLLIRPSRLGWEADPLVAVGASLDAGAPEIDVSGRGERWTRSLSIALPAVLRVDESDGGELTTRSPSGSLDAWVGVGAAREGDRTSAGVSLVLDLELERSAASLEELGPSMTAGAGEITWDGDVPSRGEGDSGQATGQDLDLALSTGFARIEGDTRPRMDIVARWIRTGEFIRAARGVVPEATSLLPGSEPPTEGVSVDSAVGANPGSFWGLPNRSAVTLGAIVGLDRGGTLRDPRLRLEAAASGGPAWPTFSETVLVEGRYTQDESTATTTYRDIGLRVAGHLSATFGWAVDEGGSRPTIRVRSEGRLDLLHESLDLDVCVEACAESLERTEYAKLSFPTALDLRLSERVTASAGLSPLAYVYRYAHELDSDEVIGTTDRDFILGFGVRGGLRYEHHGWVLGASFAGSSGSSSFGVASGGMGGGSYTAPRAMPDELGFSGPQLSLSPLLWIGWRP